MPKPVTFRPKATKPTRDKQIPDHLKSTYKAPLTVNPTLHLNYNISEVGKEVQIAKLLGAMKKARRHIKNLIQRKYREPSNAEYFEAQILKYESIYNERALRISILNKDLKVQEKKEKTKKERLKMEMQAHIKNLEKIVPNPVKDGLKEYHPVTQEQKDAEKFFKRKVYVDGKIKSKRLKRFSKK